MNSTNVLLPPSLAFFAKVLLLLLKKMSPQSRLAKASDSMAPP